MTSPLAFYNPRSRQVGVVLMTGLLGTTMAFFMTLYLPGYGGTLTVTDGTSLYVVARQRAPQTPGPQFFFARSRDGTSFDPPNFRSGAPVAG